MLAVIDYGMGNLHTVCHRFSSAGADVKVVDKPAGLTGVDGIILPGVGHFRAGMEALRKSELDTALRNISAEGIPIFGICLGCQLLCDYSEEGDVGGLGLINGRVSHFPVGRMNGLKVPHMGWNTILKSRDDLFLKDVMGDSFFYFVHSYHLVDVENEVILGTTSYGAAFPSVVRKGNVMGTQFHPEKSHDGGLRILKNFVEMCECTDPA